MARRSYGKFNLNGYSIVYSIYSTESSSCSMSLTTLGIISLLKLTILVVL